MKIYLINWVCSEGFFDGSETITFLGTDPKDVIADAYKQYIESADADSSDKLEPDSEVLTEKEFTALMEDGFRQGKACMDCYALLQFYDSHQQFEPLCLDIGANIIDRNSYIATKLWSREDVLSVLTERGFEGTEEQIDAVVNTGILDGLNECTDQDWEVIGYAVHEALERTA
jgi:hypothetical protein